MSATYIMIRKISITEVHADAIVNAANTGLQPGGGVCGAIFRAAGYDELRAACEKIGHCPTGSAAITPGFALPAKYVIHAVGPVWGGGQHQEPQRLYGAYQSALGLAADSGCHSIAFPLISAGIFGYPLEGAWRKAIQACRDFVQDHPGAIREILFAVLDEKIRQVGRDTLREQAPELAAASREDWKTHPMPEKHETFVLDRSFSAAQLDNLRRGNVPGMMEDKWFYFVEDDVLYAHRSWTGYCIFTLELSSGSQHTAVVNRDPEQYNNRNTEDDRGYLNELLDWWTQPRYDSKEVWINETLEALKKQGGGVPAEKPTPVIEKQAALKVQSLKDGEETSAAGEGAPEAFTAWVQGATPVHEILRVGSREVPAVYFHKIDEPDGYLSNWYLSDFTLEGIAFSSMEQYIMYTKSIQMGDEEIAEKILRTRSVARQKALGKKAKGYVENLWAGSRQAIAVRGLYAKFSQNEDLRRQLLATGDAWLVESAFKDTIWACGQRLTSEKRKDVATWRGTNILGFALMQVREMLRDEENPK